MKIEVDFDKKGERLIYRGYRVGDKRWRTRNIQKDYDNAANFAEKQGSVIISDNVYKFEYLINSGLKLVLS